jgi:hypothetical protein
MVSSEGKVFSFRPPLYIAQAAFFNAKLIFFLILFRNVLYSIANSDRVLVEGGSS